MNKLPNDSKKKNKFNKSIEIPSTENKFQKKIQILLLFFGFSLWQIYIYRTFFSNIFYITFMSFKKPRDKTRFK